MESIFIITEGETEEQFYKKTLPNSFPKYSFSVCQMPTKRNASSRKYKGGTIKYSVCVKNIEKFIRSGSHFKYIILIYDYYGLHESFFHGYKGPENLQEKIDFAVNRLEEEIDNKKFRFILQVHEFETYLFSMPSITVSHFGGGIKEQKELEKIIEAAEDNPEKINNSIQTSPAKRLEKIFPEFQNGKVSDGVIIAQKIGINNIRERCPRFNSFCSILDG